MSTEIQKQEEISMLNTGTLPTMQEIFSQKDSFEHAQRVAKMLSSSTLIPARFQKDVANTMIALEMANRLGAAPLMVMQNLYVVHGNPAWSGQFIIAAINSCKKFHDLEFEIQGEGMDLWCRAFADDRRTGRIKKGAKVSMQMAKAEGWIDKNGSKWKTMPEQMIMYRAASFFGRIHCPDVLMGMYSVEEVEDFTVMSDSTMDEYIMSLINTSILDEDTRDIIRSKVESGITKQEAGRILEELKDNQLEPVKSGLNYNATDAKKALKNAIKKD